ncbi:MAG: hypothetical protein ACRBB0_27175 [Pelagimonas sp.]|uniref:hypothetical protein n=1 Tax=Pelagimonas sp. TaxID=2073170 RepID=UPI003D6BBAF5
MIMPISGPLPSREIRIDAWLRAKEKQRLEDGTSARIQPHQIDRLSAMINGTPADHSGSAEVFLLTNRRNLLCQKLGFEARSASAKKGGAQ